MSRIIISELLFNASSLLKPSIGEGGVLFYNKSTTYSRAEL